MHHYRKAKVIPYNQICAKYIWTLLYPKIMKNNYLILGVEPELACYGSEQEGVIKQD